MNQILQGVNQIMEFQVFNIPVIILPIILSIVLLSFRFAFSFKSIQNSVSVGKRVNNIGGFGVLMSCIGGALGIGNIIAGCMSVKHFGPGILLWIIALSFIISAGKFFEVALSCSKKYIEGSNPGPISYIQDAFASKGNQKLGLYAAKLFAFGFTISYLLIGIIQANQFVSIASVNSNAQLILSFIIAAIVLFFLIKNMKEISIFSTVMVPLMLVIQTYICVKIVYESSHSLNEIINIIIKDAFNSITAPIQAMVAYAMQRMVLATDVGTGISGLLSADSKIQQHTKQGLLSACEPLLVGLVVSIVGIAVIAGNIDLTGKTGIAIFTTSIKSKLDLHLFIFSVFMFAITTIVTRVYASIKSFLFLSEGKYKTIIIAVATISVCLSSYINFDQILSLIDFVLMISVLPNLAAIIMLTKRQKLTSLLNNFKGNGEK